PCRLSLGGTMDSSRLKPYALILCIFLALCLLVAPRSSDAQSFTVTDLGSGDMVSSAINNVGQVVGFTSVIRADHTFGEDAFLWTPTFPNGTTGAAADIGGLPNANITYANAINIAGTVVGRSFTPNNGTPFNGIHAFQFAGGKMTDLGVPGGFE